MNTSVQNNLLGKVSSYKDGLLVLLLCAAGLVAYANSFHVPFIFDDERSITGNPAIDTLWTAWPAKVEVRSALGWRRPVAHLTLATNYALGGSNTTGYHVFNLVVHLLAGLALFGLVRRTLLLPRLRTTYAQNASYLAFAVALVWLLHPLVTQGVTYVIQRCESMMGMFYLASLYTVLRGSQSSRRWSWAWYLASFVTLSLGMGTKEVMATAPLVILLYDRVFLSDSWKSLAGRRWGLYLVFLLAVARMGMAVGPTLSQVSRRSTIGFTSQSVTSWEYLSSQPGVILHYLRLAVWPHPLCLDYSWPVARTSMAIFLPGAAIVGLLLASVWALRRCPPIGFLGVAFFVILAPTSSFVPISDLAFEHRMYLPLTALVVLAVIGFHRLAGRLLRADRPRGLLQTAVLLLVAAALLTGTIRRNDLYNHPIEMWQSVVGVAPRNARAFTNLASEFERQGRFDEAVKSYNKAIGVEPNALTYHNLANLYLQRSDLGEAVMYYQKALEVRPDFVPSRVDFAIVLKDLGKTDEAVAHLRQAIESNPKFVRAYVVLGVALESQGKRGEAEKLYRKALERRPRFVDAHVQLGFLLWEQDRFEEAADHFKLALDVNPNQSRVLYRLGDINLEQNHLTEALSYFHEAFQIEPELLRQAGDLIWALAASADDAQRSGAEAVALAERRAALIGRDDPAALDMLAAAYAETGRWNEAVATAQKAIDLATAAGRDDLAGEIKTRQRLYQQQTPYRLPIAP